MEDEYCRISRGDILITAIGNPNIDINVKLRSRELLDLFNLPLNGHLPTCMEFIKNLEKEIPKYSTNISHTPGGCVQNTLKIFQWLNKTKCQSVMIGTIGYDQDGTNLQEDLRNNGIIPLYTRIRDSRTCFVYIFTFENNVSYVYDLTVGAARLYSFDHINQQQHAHLCLQNSKIVLIEAFFTLHSIDVSLYILETCKQSNVATAFNICGEYVPVKFPNAVIPFVKNCDIVIGNKLEFSCLCQVMDISTDNYKQALVDVHKIMLSEDLPKKYELKTLETHRKILIITNGQEPVHCVFSRESNILEYHLSTIDPTLMKDTTGAGDSFLAGVLYGVLYGSAIEECLEIGHRTAIEIIKQTGCVVPNIDSSNITNI